MPLLAPPEPHLSRLHPVPVPVASYRTSGPPPALTSTHPPSRHRQCEWHARRKPRQISRCRSVEHRRHAWRTHAVRHACNRCTTRHAYKLRQKGFTIGSSICALSGGCVGKGNPRGRRLRPCAHTVEHPTGSHCPSLGIPKRCPPLPPWSHACQHRTLSPNPLVAVGAPPPNHHPLLVTQP
jgi:hypothetical protein